MTSPPRQHEWQGEPIGVAHASSGSADEVLQRFAVSYEYPVIFTARVFDPRNPILADTVARIEPDRRHRCLVFLDSGLSARRSLLAAEISAYARHHASRIELVAPPVEVPGGEVIKNDLHALARLQRLAFEHRLDRHCFVIAVGGGAVLDAVGFVAATSHRGLRLIRVPTTVLAQNDSGVGVKNAVNLYGTKNFCGTFAPPFAVLNDSDFIAVLPPRERIPGMAEAVKVALIRDAGFFRWLERHADDLVLSEPAAMASMIRRCAELHMRQIAQGGDPFETGSARPLDFGHWAAHRLEALTHHHLRHGEAVAIGVALDTRYSVLAGMLPPGDDQRVAALLKQLGFRLWHPALAQRGGGGGPLLVMEGLREFREHLGGELTVTLLAGIGHGVEVHAMDEALIADAIEWLHEQGGAG
ncbi:MAG TPA: 3-dehydroquinate synthase [Roseomonas sp.]|jgi:3-dehydroquinate synthase